VRCTLSPLSIFLRDHDFCDSSIVETHAFQGLHFISRQWVHWCCGKHSPREDLLSTVLQGASYLNTVTQIYLKTLSEKTGSKIYGKAEFQNPGGSVKDRAALGIIEAAEADGR